MHIVFKYHHLVHRLIVEMVEAFLGKTICQVIVFACMRIFNCDFYRIMEFVFTYHIEKY